ncbi:MAG TPA: sugar ABC transporter permease, partial [Candidatus Synoicihabitans sp.]|nr:sugar ABC transporter permease [Candidatus Synoicihabitans sp.]
MTTREWRNLRQGLAFTSLWIIGLSVFTAYPVLASLYYSFCDYSILKSPVWIGVENYQQLATDGAFWKSLRNTLFYAGLSVPLGTVVALTLALMLNQDVRGRAFFRVCFYLPSIVPIVASAMLWMWIFNGEFGLLNWALQPLLAPFGLTPPTWLADPAWAKPALVLMSLWGTGNAMVIYLAGLQGIPAELHEAAKVDGATTLQRFFRITIPLMHPAILVALLFRTLDAFRIFDNIFIIQPGGALG